MLELLKRYFRCRCVPQPSSNDCPTLISQAARNKQGCITVPDYETLFICGFCPGALPCCQSGLECLYSNDLPTSASASLPAPRLQMDACYWAQLELYVSSSQPVGLDPLRKAPTPK